MEEEARRILSDTCGPTSRPDNLADIGYGCSAKRTASSSSCRHARWDASRRVSTDGPARHQCRLGAHAAPVTRVLHWVAAQPLSEMAIAAITVMEVRFGIAVLARGKRRTDLDARFRDFLAQGFAGRVLPFDQRAANACADIRAERRCVGRPITTEDGMIAAIARMHGAPVATRDVDGFEGCGVTLINPWEA